MKFKLELYYEPKSTLNKKIVAEENTEIEIMVLVPDGYIFESFKLINKESNEESIFSIKEQNKDDCYSIIMPNYDSRLIPIFNKDKNKIKVSFNLRTLCTKFLGDEYLYMTSMEELLTFNNKDHKKLIENRGLEKIINKKYRLGYITDAFYSDDYDTGSEDTYIVDTPIYYSKVSTLKVVLCLPEKYDLKLVFNNKTLKDCDEVIKNNEYYKYIYKNILLQEDTVISLIFD